MRTDMEEAIHLLVYFESALNTLSKDNRFSGLKLQEAANIALARHKLLPPTDEGAHEDDAPLAQKCTLLMCVHLTWQLSPTLAAP